MNMRSF